MIQIKISVDEKDKIFDQLNTDGCTFGEVSSALLRLKQIEQILIDMEFEDNFKVEESK